MTQAAVSYQIKLLEERVGTPLFLRLPRQVRADRYRPAAVGAVSEAFDALRAAFATVEDEAGGVLTISAMRGLRRQLAGAAHRLLPAAPPRPCGPAVHLQPPGRLRARGGRHRPARRGAAAGPGWPRTACSRSRFTPVCSPELLRRLGPVRDAGGPAAPAAADPDRSLVAQLVRARRRGGRRARDAARDRPGFAADRRPGGAGRPGGRHAHARRCGPPSWHPGASCSRSTLSATTARATGWSTRKRAATSRRSAPGATGCSPRSALRAEPWR